ncbi:MAG: MgtC/SapB family protein [Gemmatimonadota bacterium]|nr:MgtC/SapB family protein [Gemmatimonadota bacterium]
MPAALAAYAPMVRDLRLDLLVKLLVAVVCGGVVGLEREYSGKPAGLRTNILICLGSAILMDLSIRIGVLDNGTRVGDPARLAAQVISGIGFLGAGTILQARGVVVGLTTAATIWVVAAIGLTVGAGNFVEGIGSTALVASVLVGLAKVEKRLHARRRVVTATLRTKHDASFNDICDVLGTYNIFVQQKKIFSHQDDTTYELRLIGPTFQFDNAASELMRRPDVLSVQVE